MTKDHSHGLFVVLMIVLLDCEEDALPGSMAIDYREPVLTDAWRYCQLVEALCLTDEVVIEVPEEGSISIATGDLEYQFLFFATEVARDNDRRTMLRCDDGEVLLRLALAVRPQRRQWLIGSRVAGIIVLHRRRQHEARLGTHLTNRLSRTIDLP